MATPPAAHPPHLEETAAAASRYLETLTVLDDARMRAPSLLPGWSRGHVVAHLARNADGLVRLLTTARNGDDISMYDSQTGRDTDIDAGAFRSAADLRTDAAGSERRYRQALSAMTPDAWQANVRRVPGADPFPVSDVPRMRRMEIEVHHADLGTGYTAANWPADLAVVVLDRVERDRDRAEGPSVALRSTATDRLWTFGKGPGPVIAGTETDLAWWALGRGDGAGLVSSTGELPDLGKWR